MKPGWPYAGVVLCLVAVAGCRDHSNASQTEKHGARVGRCAKLPQRDAVTLKGGAIADVRILSDGKIFLYVPAEWFHGAFADNPNKPGVAAGSVERYKPAVMMNECPGVIHIATSHIDIRIPVLDRARNRAHRRFSPDSEIDYVSLFGPQLVHSRDGLLEWPTDEYPTAQVNIIPAVLSAQYPWTPDPARGVNSPSWIAMRDKVVELTKWMMTPPNRRDNEKVFDLRSNQ